MKAPALTCLNQAVENGITRTREQWQRWGNRKLSQQERAAGWVCVVAFFVSYYRVNFANQPRVLKITLNGKIRS